MPPRRSTFCDSWHRVSDLRPRLRPSVVMRRHRYRGRTWHVIGDEAGTTYARIDEAAYHVAAMLDGRRTIAEIWAVCNEQLADHAPTQGEVIRLLGQLYTANLLQGDVAPESEQLFERFRQRTRREFKSQLSSFLSLRITLLDPNAFLQATVPFVGWLFRPVGFVLWLALLITAGYNLVPRIGELGGGFSAQALLAPENLLMLYGVFAVIKTIHELGHGYACVHFGRRDGVRTEVHRLGVLLLVFVPTPFVDATSSWLIRNKYHRAAIGAAGMYFELAVAAIAALIWANTGDDHPLLRALCLNTMAVASVATIAFNINPLLRFDGYYILSDLLELPNLAQQAQRHLRLLARRYLFGLHQLEPVAHSLGEAAWLTVYQLLAGVYRLFISFSIIFFVYQQFFILGVIMAIAALVMWVFMPIGQLIKYVLTHPELERVRLRALSVSSAVAAIIAIGVGVIPVPEHIRAEGVLEPVRLLAVHTAVEGQLLRVLPSGSLADPAGPPLAEAANQRIVSEIAETRATLRAVELQREMKRTEDPAQVQMWNRQIEAIHQRLARLETQRDQLTVHAPFRGVWVAPTAARMEQAHLRRGEKLGLLADLTAMTIRVTADQTLGPRVLPEIGSGESAAVEFRVRRRPDLAFSGVVHQVLPGAQHQLPSAALATVAGGNTAIDTRDPQGMRTVEPFFEVQIQPGPSGGAAWDEQRLMLCTGQRVVVRFTLPSKPLAVQCWRWIEQLMQRRKSISDAPA